MTGKTLAIGDLCVCDCCKHIAPCAVIGVSHGHKKGLCANCAKISAYNSTERETPIHIQNVDSWRVGLEIECSAHGYDNARMIKCHTAASTTFWKAAPEHDSSLNDIDLDGEGIEYHYDIKNLCGVKATLTTIYGIYGDSLTDVYSGQHINVSYDDMTNFDFCKIKEYGERIFRPLIDHMKNNNSDTINIWGRYFTSYADITINNGHYDAFHIKDNRIEFRLAKFQSVNQYVVLINLCLDIVKTIRNNFCYNDYDSHKADITANKLIKLFDKYSKCEAQCQKAERNKLER